jgi:Ti-type conjugative transfer relaxase TraA
LIPRCTVGRGITGAVRYILGEGRNPETGKPRLLTTSDISRVAWFGGTGFGFDINSVSDADLARRMMEFDAQNQTSRTRPCLKDCVHLSLGWRPGETPTIMQMNEAARDALKALGMENGRALFAIHSDEGYAHIHIVASKINPATGRAYDLKENYLKLSRWAEQYERDHGGVVCAGREEANALRDAIRARDAAAVLLLIAKQRATFTGNDLDRALYKEIKDRLARSQFAARILRRHDIVHLADGPDALPSRYTTRSVLHAEGHVLHAVQGLECNHRHDVPEATRLTVLLQERFRRMSEEQAAAFRHATGKGGLALIDGRAGTGKSYTLSAIREAYEAGGRQVVGLAPTNAVAQDMRRDGFRRAATIHSELFALNNGRVAWDERTVVIVDEAAMVDTELMAMLTAHAYHAGAKLLLVGDDRQLSSIDHGGMFGALKDRYGAASLTEVRRQSKDDDRRATELMAEGNFYEALERYDAKGAIHWTASQDQARADLVRRWAADTAADPSKSHFVFAYTNLDVDALNRDLRRVREQRGELGASHVFETKHGRHAFSTGDRIQFTGTEKRLGLYNGNVGIIESIEGVAITVRLDGHDGRRLTFDADAFDQFRHGYAGTIYKGQGRTIDRTYLFHSQHWRSAASYVALSRHRERAEVFVAHETAADLRQLARQMGRIEERRAASQFFCVGEQAATVRPPTPSDLLKHLGRLSPARRRLQPIEGWRAAVKSNFGQSDAAHGQPSDMRPLRTRHSGNLDDGKLESSITIRSDVFPGIDTKQNSVRHDFRIARGVLVRHRYVRPLLLRIWRQVALWASHSTSVPSRPNSRRRFEPRVPR